MKIQTKPEYVGSQHFAFLRIDVDVRGHIVRIPCLSGNDPFFKKLIGIPVTFQAVAVYNLHEDKQLPANPIGEEKLYYALSVRSAIQALREQGNIISSHPDEHVICYLTREDVHLKTTL